MDIRERGANRLSNVIMSIVDNKKAYHDYFIEEKFEAGVALLGWEVKAVRAGRAHIKEAYVVVKDGEIVVIGSHITPLISASTHVNPDATRTRKLLLHRREIRRLGFTGDEERTVEAGPEGDRRVDPRGAEGLTARRKYDRARAPPA